MIKRVIVIVLSLLLLALCVGAIVFIGQDKQVSGGQSSSVIVKYLNEDGSLYLREKHKKGDILVFPDYNAPDGYYFEGWKIDGVDEVITSFEVRSSTKFTPFLSQIYSFDGSQNFEYFSDNGVSDYSSVSFDYKVISGNYFAVSLFGDRWHNDTYEYVVFSDEGYIGDSEGVQISSLSDGWIHVELPYYVYESTCLSHYDHHDDYGTFDRLHVCKIASEYSVRYLDKEVAHVLLKNITFIE